MADRSFAKGLHPSVTGVCTARPEITDYHIAFAMQRRPRVGWQNIANMLRVNLVDLQRACDRGLVTIVAIERAAVEASPAPRRMKRPTMAMLVLDAMSAGGVWTSTKLIDAIAATSLKTGVKNINVALAGLLRAGLVSQVKRRAPYAITELGRTERREWQKRLAADHG